MSGTPHGPGRPLSAEETARVVELAQYFAREGMTEELAGFVDHGLPPDVADHDGNTLLMLAAYHGHAATVAALVERGADVDRRNHRDQSPVAGALFKGEDAVVRTLVAAGADLDAGTPSGRATAAMFERQDLLP
ncbi:ankyrin repeat domain-containing protein [Nocardioides aurantiacus]|uniref:ankyrin repeat domain-containing protein n=1 Tax=Nocardioides aurantiacus TaxID=86796 RepID=UPI00403F3BBD